MGWLFTHLLRETFSLLSMIPIDIPLTVMAEIFVTSMVGIMFWFAFQEAAESLMDLMPHAKPDAARGASAQTLLDRDYSSPWRSQWT